MTVKLLIEHHLEFLSFKGGCTGLPESRLANMPHCWKSHVTVQLLYETPDSPYSNFIWTGTQDFGMPEVKALGRLTHCMFMRSLVALLIQNLTFLDEEMSRFSNTRV